MISATSGYVGSRKMRPIHWLSVGGVLPSPPLPPRVFLNRGSATGRAFLCRRGAGTHLRRRRWSSYVVETSPGNRQPALLLAEPLAPDAARPLATAL
jgi:hypothetical protein